MSSDLAAAPEAAPAGLDVTRSPGLAAFRLNAFRVLRLKASAASNEAVWKSEKILARRRAGLDDPEPEVIGWLPLPDEIDLREAAQRMEEPLRRLRDQLLWFDFEGDPRGSELKQALSAGDIKALVAYLAITDKDIPLDEPESESESEEGDAGTDYEEAAKKRQRPLTAHRLNQANARLLLALSWLHDTGPVPLAGNPGARRTTPRLAFKDEKGLTAAKSVHALFPADAPEGRQAAWQPMLRDGLTRWGALLKNPWLSSYLESAITALDDDLVTSDDVEPLMNAVATAIADAVVGEMKLLMLAGGIDRVLELLGIATKSGIDPSHWTVAFRPIRALFRAELDDLGSLIDPTKPANLRELDLYLQRVNALGVMWASVETDESFGLDQMIDGAVNQAIDRIRSIENASAVLDRIEEVLGEAAKMAKSPSTAERAREMARNVASHREGLCNYCEKRSAKAASSCVLKGKKEISRERIFNGVRITYSTTVSLVSRCETCAELHGFFQQSRNVIAILACVLVTIGWILFQSADGGSIFVGMLVAAAGAFIAFTTLTWRLTPKGETSYSSYRKSEGYRRLADQGYGIESYDYTRDAGARLMKERGIT
ncbi:MAG: hypothetical protein ABJE95_08215 [Byssovorax sp.]